MGAKGLETLQERLQTGTAALRQMQQALRNLKSGGVEAESSIKGLKDQIAAQRATIAGAQGAYIKLGGSFAGAKAGGASKPDAMGIKGLLGSVKDAGGPLGSLAGKLLGVKGGAVGAAIGLVAMAVAMTAVTVATAKGIVELAEYGVAVADARRSELLRLEGLTKIRNFWSGFGGNATRAADKAGFLQSTIDDVSSSVAISRDRVGEYATQLYKMGLRGGNLQAALKGVATTAAVQGEQQASIFASWAAGANLTGQSVKALAADVQARLGGIAKAQLLSLDVQTLKLHESFAMLFSGLRLDKLLNGLNAITQLFSQSTVTGQALKQLVEVIFQPLIDQVGNTGPLLKRFFQGMVLGLQRIVIIGLTVAVWFKKTFGEIGPKNLDLTTAAVWGGKLAVFALAATIPLVGAAFIGLGAIAMPIITPIVAGLWSMVVAGALLALPFLLAAVAIGAVGAALYQAYQLWKETDWGELGTALWQGIVNGIDSGAQWVYKAVARLAHTAKKAFADILNMHSPSRVMFGMGTMIPRGAAMGVDNGRPHLQAAVRRMGVDAARLDGGGEGFTPSVGYMGAEASGGVAAGGGSRGGGGARTISIGVIQVHTAATDARGITADIRRALEAEFSGLAAGYAAEGAS